jgi:hypothetical protein
MTFMRAALCTGQGGSARLADKQASLSFHFSGRERFRARVDVISIACSKIFGAIVLRSGIVRHHHKPILWKRVANARRCTREVKLHQYSQEPTVQNEQSDYPHVPGSI